MRQNDEIVNELQENGIDLPPHIKAPYEVPAGFFNTFSENILAEIQAEVFLSTLPKEVPHTTPVGYFEALPGQIMEDIQSGEFLKTLPKTLPYAMDEGYFDTLSGDLTTKINPKRELKPLRRGRSLISRFAVAASLLIILATGFFMINKKESRTLEQELALISDAEISAYINAHQAEFDDQLSYQSIDESQIDVNALENDIYSSYLDELTDEEIKDIL